MLQGEWGVSMRTSVPLYMGTVLFSIVDIGLGLGFLEHSFLEAGSRKAAIEVFVFRACRRKWYPQLMGSQVFI